MSYRIKEHLSENPWLAAVSFCEKNLTPSQHLKMIELFLKFPQVFKQSPNDFGLANDFLFNIHLKDKTPIRGPVYKTEYKKAQALQQIVDQYLAAGIIEPSTSAWNQPVCLVLKSDGSYRLVLDMRRINAQTKIEPVPLPNLDTYLDSLGGNNYFTICDFDSAFLQCLLNPEHKDYLAFTANGRKYNMKRMPFGAVNSGFYFTKLLNKVLEGIPMTHMLAYVDDCLLFSQTFDQHIDRLTELFTRLSTSGLKLKPSKCHIFQSSIKYLGHVVSASGISPCPEKVRAILQAETPKTPSDVKSFLGAVQWFSRFLPALQQIASPLSDLLKKNTRFEWNPLLDACFSEIKTRLASSPILAHFDPHRPLHLYSDSSKKGAGGALIQEDDEGAKHKVEINITIYHQ